METINRQNVLDLLNEDWKGYVRSFQRLSPEAQAAFLKNQGYKRLADLLAHIAAWWDVGLENIQNYRRDPSVRQPDVDVDEFNASAVQRVLAFTDAEQVRAFEAARLKFVELVTGLSDADFKDDRILNQIRMELVNHLEDHRIPD
jgi:hypothetical protein